VVPSSHPKSKQFDVPLMMRSYRSLSARNVLRKECHSVAARRAAQKSVTAMPPASMTLGGDNSDYTQYTQRYVDCERVLLLPNACIQLWNCDRIRKQLND